MKAVLEGVAGPNEGGLGLHGVAGYRTTLAHRFKCQSNCRSDSN